ncbi:MAG: helix-turn-helix domain-containing protein [Clostridiales bacterium]|nr:helix-turn-helix domain-containing protein [Clostridiales bacterium]
MNAYLIAKLKEGRLNKGLKQSDVTKLVGIKNTTLSNYENGVTEPDIDTFLQLCELYELDYATILGEAYGLNISGTDFDIRPSEIEIVKCYRLLDSSGQKHVDTVMLWEKERIEQVQEASDRATTVIDFQNHTSSVSRLVEYFRSASAGSGVFILGNEVSDRIEIPDTPENRKVDFAIKVSGDSMEPDYYDGDIVLVSQKSVLLHGDVGIFVVNSNVYIKEYGETELVSRNPNADNIPISEYDNIVCMGKVIGKL